MLGYPGPQPGGHPVSTRRGPALGLLFSGPGLCISRGTGQSKGPCPCVGTPPAPPPPPPNAGSSRGVGAWVLGLGGCPGGLCPWRLRSERQGADVGESSSGTCTSVEEQCVWGRSWRMCRPLTVIPEVFWGCLWE